MTDIDNLDNTCRADNISMFLPDISEYDFNICSINDLEQFSSKQTDMVLYETIGNSIIDDHNFTKWLQQSFEILTDKQQEFCNHHTYLKEADASYLSTIGSIVKEKLNIIAPFVAPISLLPLLYFYPATFGVEIATLFISGILAEILITYQQEAADIIGIDKEKVIKIADLINSIRWPLVGIAAGVSFSKVIEASIGNKIISKVLSTAMSTSFTHAYINSAEILNQGILLFWSGNPLEHHIHNITSAGNTRDIWGSLTFFTTQKLFDEILKTTTKQNIIQPHIRSFTYKEDLAIKILSIAFMNSIHRSIATSIANSLEGECSNTWRHVMFPFEFIAKSLLDTFYSGHTYVNALLPALVGAMIKRFRY